MKRKAKKAATVSKSKTKSKPAKAAPKAKAAVKTKASVKSKSPNKAKASGKTKPVAKTQPAAKSTVKAKPPTADPKASAGKLNLKPLDNRIVIEVEEGVKMTAGGLYIPDTAQVAGNQKGTVLAVGSGHVSKKGKKRPLELKVGDQVVFAEWAGDKLEWNGKPVRILRESDVLGLVD